MSTRRRAPAERSQARLGARRWSWQGQWLCSWAGGVLACSSPTDVVAVFDPNDTAVEAASSPRPIPDVASDQGSDEDTGVVIVLGRPVPNWQGATLEWPLDTRLSKFFAEPDHDSHAKRTQSDPHGAMNGSGPTPAEPTPTMRILDSDGDVAERLKALFAEAPHVPGTQQSVVVRDEFDDLYLIVLKDEECAPASDRGTGSGCSAPLGFE